MEKTPHPSLQRQCFQHDVLLLHPLPHPPPLPHTQTHTNSYTWLTGLLFFSVCFTSAVWTVSVVHDKRRGLIIDIGTPSARMYSYLTTKKTSIMDLHKVFSRVQKSYSNSIVMYTRHRLLPKHMGQPEHWGEGSPSNDWSAPCCMKAVLSKKTIIMDSHKVFSRVQNHIQTVSLCIQSISYFLNILHNQSIEEKAPHPMTGLLHAVWKPSCYVIEPKNVNRYKTPITIHHIQIGQANKSKHTRIILV